MKRMLLFVLILIINCWAVPKPMESIENYSVLMIHGAYGWNEGFIWPHMPEDYWKYAYGMDDLWIWNMLEEHVDYGTGDSSRISEFADVLASLDVDLPSAYDDTVYLGKANLGRYGSEDRLTYWINKNVFEDDLSRKPKDSYIYHWRSFSNPANSSNNNGRELGDRLWNKGNLHYGKGGFGHRRALTEEAQEVKAKYTYFDKSQNKEVPLNGQVALDSIRKKPDLYRQIPSRYILVGHSMGGVVSREYVQGNYYNDDVDKIITLDSPHEGTGALNMQIKNEARGELLKDKNMSSIATGIATTELTAIPLILFCKTESCYSTGLLIGFVGATALNLLDVLATRIFAPQIYFQTDSLVHYVDPNQKGYGTIDSLNNLPYIADSLPMFRLLASEYGMTFTDPDEVLDNAFLSVVFSLIPDNVAFVFANAGSQFMGTGDLSTRLANAVMSAVVGLFGIPMTENGSSLVSEESGYGVNLDVLNDPSVDIKKHRFNAAPLASGWPGSIGVSLGALAISYTVMDKLFSWNFGDAYVKTAKLALSIGFWASFVPSIAGVAAAGILDISNSHTMPLYNTLLDTMKAAKNSFTPIGNGASSHTPYLMEDFLYERPFVNLALNDSRTMDSLARNSSASLNPNCYFESDSLQKEPLCEVGLYGTRDSVRIKDSVVTVGSVSKPVYNSVNDKGDSVFADTLHIYGTFEQRKYSEFRSSPLKFKAESDWYKVGVKVDRWERVDGLKPNGDLAPKGVPIRHVERYSVPDIVATGFIEKYSFVVDDLMPHRMRQIKMTFNSNEEVAWECNIKAAEDDPHACAVYKRKLGNSWTLAKTIGNGGYVAHPIKKNGRFDFNARTYFGNLADIQKDNQNTVMISMVNKIGLSNTQRFYYLFKATANMLKPTWPQHDVVLNAVDGFGVYVSALDYQGFRVRSAKDGIFSDPLGTPAQVGASLPMVMTLDSSGSSAIFESKQKILSPVEGDYRWVVDAVVNNSEKDSSKTDSYEVHFTVDRSAPAFTLTSDAMMNPDSSMFITRFKWVGRDSADRAKGSDIRVMLA